MKYFQMNFGDYRKASEEVWQRQDSLAQKHSRFHMSADGMDTSVWTDDPAGEVALRKVLQDLDITFTESDQQQVVTWLDRFF